MKSIALIVALLAGPVMAQPTLPYETLLKVTEIYKPVEIDGQKMIRILVKPKDKEMKREDLVFTLVRNGTILATIRPEVLDHSGMETDAKSRAYPWVMFVPFDPTYTDCSLLQNQPWGSMELGFWADIQFEEGKLKIQNE